MPLPHGRPDRLLAPHARQVNRFVLHDDREEPALCADRLYEGDAFSVAVLHEPKIVFLDEPTGGVDPITRRQFWEMIYETAERGITVFVTTHYMDEAEYCDRITIMSEGRIVALDTPAALKKQYEAQTVEEVFIKIARPFITPRNSQMGGYITGRT